MPRGCRRRATVRASAPRVAAGQFGRAADGSRRAGSSRWKRATTTQRATAELGVDPVGAGVEVAEARGAGASARTPTAHSSGSSGECLLATTCRRHGPGRGRGRGPAARPRAHRDRSSPRVGTGRVVGEGAEHRSCPRPRPRRARRVRAAGRPSSSRRRPSAQVTGRRRGAAGRGSPRPGTTPAAPACRPRRWR